MEYHVDNITFTEPIDINIMQRNNDDRYVNHIVKQLRDLNITVIQEAPEPFKINGFVLPSVE